MKFSRKKKVNRYMTFFKNNYGFHAPYQVLLDGTLCLAALQAKVQLSEQLPKYLDSELKLLTTQCVVLEMEKLGPTLYGALKVAKTFNVHKCGHEKSPIGASQCLLSMVSPNNPQRYIIASQDPTLRENVREIPGTPVMYLHYMAPTLEKPSDYSVKVAAAVVDKRIKTQGTSMGRLQELKEKLIDDPPILKPRKKRPKAPNPLSCMKKKKKANLGTATNKKATTNGEEKEIVKRKRKRIRIPDHVKQELAKQVASTAN